MTATQALYDMTALMSRMGNCWDNLHTDIFFIRLKKKRGHGTNCAMRAGAQAHLFHFIEVFYNWSRRHSALGYGSPVRLLEDWIYKHACQ